jgi:hypothetical protein
MWLISVKDSILRSAKVKATGVEARRGQAQVFPSSFAREGFWTALSS